jgi:ribosomal protein uS17
VTAKARPPCAIAERDAPGRGDAIGDTRLPRVLLVGRFSGYLQTRFWATLRDDDVGGKVGEVFIFLFESSASNTSFALTRTMQALSFSAALSPQRVTTRAPARASSTAAPSCVRVTAKQVLEGKVVSTGAQKTATILVERKIPHPKYIKLMKKSNKFAAHDELEQCKVGDLVRIEACRPMSKTKKFILREIVVRQ